MKNKKLLAVASQGGHLIQLMRLKPVFDQYDASYVSNEYHEAMGKNFIAIVDTNRNTKCKLIMMFIQLLWITIHLRPDVVIASGAAPGYFALMLGKLFPSINAK